MAGLGTSGFGPGSGFRFTGFRHGSADGRNNSFRYPSPWWDIAHMELPTTVKHLFKWCRYHMLVNPLVSSVVRKMASYPVTPLIIDEEPEEGFKKNKDRWEDLLLRHLNIPMFQLEAGLNYYGYGNNLTSILYPFHKYLQCRGCKYKERIKRLKFRKTWDFRNFQYHMVCPRCMSNAPAIVKDEYYRSYRDIKLINWNPADISIDFNPITQKKEYAYRIPGQIRGKVLQKHKPYLEDMPHTFIMAMKTKRPVRLTPENVFHFKAPTPSLAANDSGWGYPPILPALKDSFYLQVMKKAQEAILMEHMVPLDILYPASADAVANPYMNVNLSDWKRRIESEIVKWRWDPNYKPILPLPVGYQRIGGDGKALMLTQEIRVWSEHIVVGMGVPQEFAFGGLSWTGSSVSMRMLENQFLNYRSMHEHFLRYFLIPNVSRFMAWKPVSVHMKSFKMADDIQAKQLLLSLNQLKKVSDKTLLAEFDKDALTELRTVEQEMRRGLEVRKLESLYNATIQGESQQIMTKFQMESQKKMQTAQMQQQQAQMQQQQMGMDPNQAQAGQGQAQGAPEGASGVNVIELAEAYAKKFAGMSPEEQAPVLAQMQQQNPQFHQLVVQKLEVMKALEQQPLPEKGPPRRANAGI